MAYEYNNEPSGGGNGAPSPDPNTPPEAGGSPELAQTGGKGAWRRLPRRLLAAEAGGRSSNIEGNVLSLPDGRQFVRDGPWWVDKSVVDDWSARGIDILSDPNPTPEMVQAVEKNRMPFAKGLNMARRLGVANWNDANWAAGSGGDDDPTKYGYKDWRQMRVAAVRNAQAQGVTDENTLHWLWITNPANLAQSGYLPNQQNKPPDNNPPGPATDPAQSAPNDQAAQKVINGILYRQQPDGTWLKVGPAPQTPATTRPPQPAAGLNTATQRPPLIPPSLTRLSANSGNQIGTRPADWWKGTRGAGGGAGDPFTQTNQIGTMKPPKLAPAAPSLTTPKPTFGGIKLK